MRDNGAISNRLVELGDDQIIVSRADLAGRIVYVNADFVEISGYSEAELIGQPHNISGATSPVVGHGLASSKTGIKMVTPTG